MALELSDVVQILQGYLDQYGDMDCKAYVQLEGKSITSDIDFIVRGFEQENICIFNLRKSAVQEDMELAYLGEKQ